MVEVDHVFAFVEPGGPWLDTLEGAGFKLDPGIAHPGQGTRNRRLLLHRHYLEWLWLESRGDAETNEMRLDRRADWRTSGWSPFGVALRGSLDEAGRERFVPYRPPYMPELTIWIAAASTTNPALPLVFLFDVPDVAKLWPIHRAGADAPLLAHASRATRWTRLVFTSPKSAAWPLAVKPPEVELAAGDAFALEVWLDGAAPDVAPAPHVSLRKSL